jgi:hypothetical protein
MLDGEGAFQPHSRRPHTNPRAVDLEVEDQIVRLRKTLTKKGLDAGAETIAAHLATAGVVPVPAVSTIWRILSRRGFAVAQPQKRPRSSWKTFCADQPDPTLAGRHHSLAPGDGTEVEILNILDDHSRVCIASMARLIFTGTQVWQVFLTAIGPLGPTRRGADRQRRGIHRETTRSGPGCAGGRAGPARNPDQPLSALLSADLRQGV